MSALTPFGSKLAPLFICVGAGFVGSMLYLARMGIKGPDVVFNRKGNPYPWQKIEPDQNVKFMSVNQKFEGRTREEY